MISFRYHMVTIAAVFLALAIGLIGGSAFVQPVLQRELENRTEALRGDNDALREQIDEVRLEGAGLDAFTEAALPHLVEGRLLGVPVVLVTQVGVEDALLAQTTQALVAAGAEVLTTFSATDLLGSEDPATVQQLEEILGAQVTGPQDLSAMAAAELAERLSGQISAAGEADVLAELLSGGFLAPVGTPPDATTLLQIGSPGQVVVVLSGGQGEEPALPPESFALPLVESLSALGGSVAAGESVPADFPYVALVRAAGLDGVVTVDDLDQPMGGSALVLGLDRLLSTGEGGHFGVKEGAEPLPPPP